MPWIQIITKENGPIIIDIAHLDSENRQMLDHLCTILDYLELPGRPLYNAWP